ncbi:DUF2946 family protein [Bradyrhizobium septentrionale]|uniref:DUF2946 family protein n=1 Tax=Bradyrhizobium septentrionale TaxID=1404411 RepID=A0A973W7F1_9BRAD|nr:DUF2946 family protein [Bradyrhizobium septentrionale]UGY17275.1 DUF2946 family protein [Bradyrhizobium septentrionale]UGY26019.1 DUF2946 family protein [Bradyrhizobium septentrionale]
MKWFRSNIRHGAGLALFALAIQFALSFGHFHAIASAQATASFAAHVENASRDEPRSAPDSDQAADLCAVCAVVAMVNTATPAPALPPLQLPDAVGLLPWHVDNYAAPVEFGRPHFQPRAPPIS